MQLDGTGNEDRIMDRLWAPWRMAYVSAPKSPGEADECFLCRGLSETNDAENLIVARGERTVVVVNRFPYNNGHLLIAPQSHKAQLGELDDAEVAEIHRMLVRMQSLLQEKMKPEGFNVGVNLGKAAGAGLPGHLHYHIVPRWNGDTNFMPVLGDARVIVQSLDAVRELLAEAYAA